MPSAHVVKNYLPGNFYHIYQSGFEGRNIFLDKEDFERFAALLEKNLSEKGSGQTFKKVELVAYCLLPNHFHLMFKLNEKEGITEVLRKILTAYVMYFNKKYGRKGSIFQGKPKGATVESQNLMLHLTRYIHQKPKKSSSSDDLKNYEYSSYKDYLGIRSNFWVKHEEILKFFRSPRKTSESDMLSYESFVENPLTDSAEKLGKLTLE